MVLAAGDPDGEVAAAGGGAARPCGRSTWPPIPTKVVGAASRSSR